MPSAAKGSTFAGWSSTVLRDRPAPTGPCRSARRPRSRRAPGPTGAAGITEALPPVGECADPGIGRDPPHRAEHVHQPEECPDVPAADLRGTRPPRRQGELEAERRDGEANRGRRRVVDPDAGQDPHRGEPPPGDGLRRPAPSLVSRPPHQPIGEPTAGDRRDRPPPRAPGSPASSTARAEPTAPSANRTGTSPRITRSRRRQGHQHAEQPDVRTGRPASRGSGRVPCRGRRRPAGASSNRSASLGDLPALGDQARSASFVAGCSAGSSRNHT